MLLSKWPCRYGTKSPCLQHWLSLLKQSLIKHSCKKVTQTYHILHEVLRLAPFCLEACLTVSKFPNTFWSPEENNSHLQYTTPLLFHCAMVSVDRHEWFIHSSFEQRHEWGKAQCYIEAISTESLNNQLKKTKEVRPHQLWTAVDPWLQHIHFTVINCKSKYFLHNLAAWANFHTNECN